MKNKIFLALLVLVLVVLSFTGCATSVDKLKYFYICEDESALVLSWTTSQPTKCVVSWCSDKNICQGSDKELEYDILHLVIVPADTSISYYTIVVEDSLGNVTTKRLDR